MNTQYRIRQRNVEVSTSDPRDLKVDALLLPWFASYLDEVPSGVLDSGGTEILAEIDEYPNDRDVLITSAGRLGARLLFHLNLSDDKEEYDDDEYVLPGGTMRIEPEAERKVDLNVLEERFRDAFFQASVLGLSELAIPVGEYSELVESFSGLVDAIWKACREFLSQDRGPRSIVFLVDDRDLRGQYLRHFFQRKQAEEESWGEPEEMIDKMKPQSLQIPRPSSTKPATRFENAEKVLTPDLADEAKLEGLLKELLRAYAERRDYSTVLEELRIPMRRGLSDQLVSPDDSDSGDGGVVPERLRLLGSSLAMRLPWELLEEDGVPLGEKHIFTRGTNFLHFGKKSRHGDAGISFCIAGKPAEGKHLADELRDICQRRDLEIDWRPGSRARVRLVHCIGLPAIHGLLEQDESAAELVYLELEPGEETRANFAVEMEEWSRVLLGMGCRRVLSPLASFRDNRERLGFRSVFYERLLAGASAGEALLRAQRECRQACGDQAGWFLYRIFGQTDEALVRPGKEAGSRSKIVEPSG